MIPNRMAYGETLIALAKERGDVYILDADACKSTGTLQVYEEVPEYFIQCGIAEQNMTGIAVGLARCGKVAFVATFGVFTCMRALEQVRNSVCYSNSNVKIVGTHSGLEVGQDGGTHQTVEDIAIMRTLPEMRVLIPSTPNATRKLTRLCAETFGPMYMRLGKDPAPEFYEDSDEFPLGGSKELHNGNYAAIIACGDMVSKALEASKMLEAEGKQVRVIDMYSIKPIDEEVILRAAKETKGIITVEDHSKFGGLGSAVSEILCEKYPARVIRIAIQDQFGTCDFKEKLYEMYGLTPEKIVEAVNLL